MFHRCRLKISLGAKDSLAEVGVRGESCIAKVYRCIERDLKEVDTANEHCACKARQGTKLRIGEININLKYSVVEIAATESRFAEIGALGEVDRPEIGVRKTRFVKVHLICERCSREI